MRQAVYFAPPPEHPLWRAGCAWLGRDACTDAGAADATPPARARVASPWRYGFHATLKAPCRLAPDAHADDWLAAVRSLAAAHAAFDMPRLQVDLLDGFLALVPAVPIGSDHPLRRLADDCVRQLDRWRAPLTADEQARQSRGARSARQQAQVAAWGYAHVFGDWRFHMTLSDGLAGIPEAEAQTLAAQARAHFADALAMPLRCDALCVFTEPAPGAPLVCSHRFALGHG